MPIYSAKRLSRLTGISLSLSMSAADEIGKSQKQKQENLKGSGIKSQELNKKAESGVSVGCPKGNGVSRSTTRGIKSRPRSVSPPKNRVSYDWKEFASIEIEEERGDSKNDNSDDLSRKQRTSRRWNLRDLLYRSSSEGSIQRKERERLLSPPLPPAGPSKKKNKAVKPADQLGAGKPINLKTADQLGAGKPINLKPADQLGAGKPINLKPADQLGAGKPINGGSTKAKLTSPSASPNHSLRNNKNSRTRNGVTMSSHELYYQTNRAQAEELKRRSFLPYRQGLLGCMGSFPTTTSTQHIMQPSPC
ncbi:uncharacterized protein LOC131071328 [Cryptomeria japonica]|uniref:uncharacterized protein LOC131071328 n=1 Tax=Cryptomeria japonica TaxID=3369 RepID=UPI0025AC2598|nr:uncharacterized protein LOC131071328 [Cryptomeria japonica]XP_057863102.1 uncharacterized protein LOC131071328 [Cryptomeria japonica]